MKILVSACLLGRNCKYNGGNNFNEKINALSNEHELIPICPEVMGGLSTPRTPAEIIGAIVMTKDGVNVNDAFRKGAEVTLMTAKRETPDLCILKSRSPSCGVHQIYDGTFSGTLTSGDGVTAELLKRNGFVCITEEDLDALTDMIS